MVKIDNYSLLKFYILLENMKGDEAMFKVIQAHPTYVEAVADKTDDMASAPTHYGAGSNCLVIEDSSVWVLGNDNKWHQI